MVQHGSISSLTLSDRSMDHLLQRIIYQYHLPKSTLLFWYQNSTSKSSTGVAFRLPCLLKNCVLLYLFPLGIGWYGSKCCQFYVKRNVTILGNLLKNISNTVQRRGKFVIFSYYFWHRVDPFYLFVDVSEVLAMFFMARGQPYCATILILAVPVGRSAGVAPGERLQICDRSMGIGPCISLHVYTLSLYIYIVPDNHLERHFFPKCWTLTLRTLGTPHT